MKILNLHTNEVNQNDYHYNKLTKNKIGILYIAPLNIVPDDCLACDGYVLKIADYKKLYSAIGSKFNTGSETSEEFRIPDYNITGRFLQPGANCGSQISAGIPSIDLALRVDGGGTSKQYYGNTYLTAYGTDDYGGTMSTLTNNSDEYMFQMSKAAKNKKAGDLILDTNIYGKSKTVQPPSQIVHICIKYK